MAKSKNTFTEKSVEEIALMSPEDQAQYEADRLAFESSEDNQKNKALTNDSLIKSQANYKGDSAHDLVKIEIIKDGDGKKNFYKKGDTDEVHPATAEIFIEKGIAKKVK